MRLEGKNIVIETVTDGMVAADAGDVGGGDGLTSMYRNISESDLPVTMGNWASEDVLCGLREIVASKMTIDGYLDPTIAKGYLALLGLSEG